MTINRHWAGAAGFLAAALTAVLMLLSTAALAQPTFTQYETISLSPGGQVDVGATDVFDNAGTNPRFNSATFSNPEYISSSEVTSEGRLTFEVKTAAELNALWPRPESPFTFTVEVRMGNDDGWGAGARLTYETSYDRNSSVGPIGQPSPPVFAQSSDIDAPVRTRVEVEAEDVFNNEGTNPRFTAATFSTTDYYNVSEIDEEGVLAVEAKSSTQLSNLASPPDSVFRVTVDVTMTNDEDQTGTGTLTFVTVYRKSKRHEGPPGGVSGGNSGSVQPSN